MKVSLNLLSQFIDVKEFKAQPSRLADLLTGAGLEVEEIKDLSKQFEHVVVGHILEKNKHPNADQLTLCLVDTGDQKRKIVCGAKNHNAGDKVVVALPGAVLPGNFAIKVSKIRGEESQGMLCSEKELGLKAESEGILLLPASATVGEAFATYAKLDDVIVDIKVTPNRSDCLSHYGIAREIAALQGKTVEPIKTVLNEGKESTKKMIKVSVDDERCPRYAGRLVKNIKVAPSPLWLAQSLEVLGHRSINNVVDITNYVMLMYGQPLHAFDVAKLMGAQINVRAAQKGEKFKTLDDKDLTLTGVELVIADQLAPIALAGVIGGKESGVSEKTVDVFVESAIFNAASVRRSAKLHGLDTDASQRFSRGVDPEAVVTALNKCCQLLNQFADGTVCIDPYDIYPRPASRPRIEMDLKFISQRLGLTVESADAKKILERVGCLVTGSADKLLVNPPPYRPDLKIQEDLAEEILRYKGFQNIPETLPEATSAPTLDDKEFVLEEKLGRFMRAEGLTQVVNLSLFSSNFEKKILGSHEGSSEKDFGFNLYEPVVKISNPLNQELDVMRRALFPSLLKNIEYNFKHGNAHGKIFETAPVFAKKGEEPFYEELHFAAAIWGETKSHWIKSANVPLFFQLKGALENFFSAWNYKSVKFNPAGQNYLFLHPGQSAQIVVEGKPVGFVGVLHPAMNDFLDVRSSVALCELNLSTLFANQPRSVKAKDVPKFPAMERDVALVVPMSTPAQEVKAELLKAAGNLAIACDIFDLYMGANLPPNSRSLALCVIYQDPSRTLVDEEINALHQKAVKSVCIKLGLSVR